MRSKRATLSSPVTHHENHRSLSRSPTCIGRPGADERHYRRCLEPVASRREFGAKPSPSRCGALASRRWAIMDVYEAVTSRRAVRGFTDQHVPKEVLERVLSAAAWSPSGSNLQPWNSYVLTGAPL